MITNPHLDNLIAKETYAEMLDQLTPRQLAVIALRMDEISFEAAGEILGIPRGNVYQRMVVARRRIQDCFPHVRSLVGDS